jgi:putative salt-induced outer membrane protein YdiY
MNRVKQYILREAGDFILRLILRILLILSFLGLSANAQTSQLHLSNGDRITGDVVQRVDGKIVFNSDFFGQIIVAEVDAAVINIPETPVESLTGLPPIHNKWSSNRSEPSSGIAAHSSDPSGKVSPPESKWKGKVEFGFLNQSGRSEVLNTSLRTEAEHQSDSDSLRAIGRYLYGENSNIVASNRQDVSFRWRHNISEKLFTQSLTSYTRDQISKIDLNLEQNASMGFQRHADDQQKVTVGAGLTIQYRDAEGVESGVNYLGEVFQDYTYKINGRLTLSQAINALYSPNRRVRSITSNTSTSKLTDEAENYKVRFNGSLQGQMSERISLNLRYEYEYDNAILDKNTRTDKRITSSLGYAF